MQEDGCTAEEETMLYSCQKGQTKQTVHNMSRVHTNCRESEQIPWLQASSTKHLQLKARFWFMHVPEIVLCSGMLWTAAKVERALWSEALQSQLSKAKAQGTKRKR